MKRAEIVKEAIMSGTTIVWQSRCPQCNGRLVEVGDEPHCFPCNSSWSMPRSGFKPAPEARHKKDMAIKKAKRGVKK